MIETVLDEVLAAEREAARLKAEAEAEARDIGLFIMSSVENT